MGHEISLNPVTAAPAEQPILVPLVVISPVKNEAEYIRLTLDSMVAQTYRPIEWVIVDDGSKDETREIVKEYTDAYPFIRLILREDQGSRQLGGGVVRAFNYGKDRILNQDYAYIAKLDGDMSFGPWYLQKMFEKFGENPRLACVSGRVYRQENGCFIEEFHQVEQVAGQFKLYRRTAFEEIGGFVPMLAWDGIDIHACHMKGWDTHTFLDADAWLWHHRIMGSSDRSIYVGRLRWGRGNWTMGYHPLYAIAAGVNRMSEKPVFIGGMLMIVGYFWSAIKRVPRYENLAFRRWLRKRQMQRLRRFLLGKGM